MPSNFLRFGPFEADLRTGELRKGGVRIKLARQSFQVLIALAQRAGELVTRDELQRILWPNETVVDFDHSINTAVRRIRDALNDSAEVPRYLETLPRRGYRFIAEVERLSRTPQPESAPLPTPADPPSGSPVIDWDDPIGQVVSHYRILGVLGRGGMGVVYRAEDIRLGRQVALKFLPIEHESDPIALQRFEREARSASTLNHPNVCTIYEVETHAGRAFIAMELLEGETLGARMARASDDAFLSAGFLVEVAIQVAGALEAAHAHGIIHRDIKPANIFINRRNEAKVLDFGLAKAVPQRRAVGAGGGVLDSESDSSGPTRTGAAPGTAFYMSPEQARGEELDGRDDLYSLGVVMYEAATSERPPLRFHPASAPTNLRPDLPLKFWEIVSRLLELDRALRYQTAGDAGSDLTRLKRDMSSPTNSALLGASPAAEPQTRQMRRNVIASIAAAVLVFVGGIVTIKLRPSATPAPPLQFLPFSGLSGLEDDLSFAPDGRQAAFVWNGGSGSDFHLYVKLLGLGAPVALTNGPGYDFSPAWSPDGRFVAFAHSSGADGFSVSVIPALGGAGRQVASIIRATAPDQDSRVLTWSPNGESLLISDSSSGKRPPAIVLLPLHGGEKRELTHPGANDYGDNDPEVSPDGQTLAFIRWQRNSVSEIELQPLAGGEPRQITNDGKRIAGIAWAADSRSIVFSSTRGALPGLWRIAVSGGTPELLAGVGEDAVAPAISREGNRLAYTHQAETVNIWRVPGPRAPATKARPVALVSSPRQQMSGIYSPDGKQIAFSSDRSGTWEIWVTDSDGSHPRQLTSFNGPVTGTPHWSPDGKSIAFDSRPAGHSAIFVIGQEGGEARQVTSGNFDEIVPSWSHDGRHIYFCSNRSGVQQIWQIPASGGNPTQVTKNGGFETSESPDGQWLYYSKPAGGIWSMPVSGGPEKLILNRQTGRYWTPTRDGVCFLQLDAKPRLTVNFLDTTSGRISQIGSIEKDVDWGYSGLSVSPDGQWVIYAQMDDLINRITQVDNFH